MIRNIRKVFSKPGVFLTSVQGRTFLTNEYKCNDTWNKSLSSPVLSKINLNDFYIQLDQNYGSKGTISAIDIDLFANAIQDPLHLEELKDLLHKLRLSAETGNMLESTSHATIRNFINYGYIDELIGILKEPLNYGVFLDNYSANILLNELLKEGKYELAADVATLVMLQEEFTNELTCTLCQYSCFKYILSYSPPQLASPEDKPKKVEEIKIRVKFLRNPYFDDHFDIKDPYLLSGKTLAWISQQKSDILNNNLQIIGWLVYKKYDKLLSLCKELTQIESFQVYHEVIDILQKEISMESKENHVQECVSLLNQVERVTTHTLEKSLINAVENAINKTQTDDIQAQNKLYQSWAEIRKIKLEEQSKRLDRANRIKYVQEQQKDMQEQEQKLWFFENEDKINLEIEEKEKLIDKSTTIKKISKTTDENYIPPEILPKRRQSIE